jgi:hypothetical protein
MSKNVTGWVKFIYQGGPGSQTHLEEYRYYEDIPVEQVEFELNSWCRDDVTHLEWKRVRTKNVPLVEIEYAYRRAKGTAAQGRHMSKVFKEQLKEIKGD